MCVYIYIYIYIHRDATTASLRALDVEANKPKRQMGACRYSLYLFLYFFFVYCLLSAFLLAIYLLLFFFLLFSFYLFLHVLDRCIGVCTSGYASGYA